MAHGLSISHWVLLALLAAGAVTGLLRGLSGGFGSLGGAAAAFFALWTLHDSISALLARHAQIEDALLMQGLVLVCDAVLGLVVFGVVRRIIEKGVRFLLPRTLDALLGALAGMTVAFFVWRAGLWLFRTLL